MKGKSTPVLQQKLTAVDLFSGAGELTLGLKQAGFNVLACVDKEKIPDATYSLKNHDVHCFENDIREDGAAALLKTIGLKRGELDLLAATLPGLFNATNSQKV